MSITGKKLWFLLANCGNIVTELASKLCDKAGGEALPLETAHLPANNKTGFHDDLHSAFTYSPRA